MKVCAEIGVIVVSLRDGGAGEGNRQSLNLLDERDVPSVCPAQLDGIVYYNLGINPAWLTAHHYP